MVEKDPPIERAHAKRYVYSTTVVPPNPADAGRSFSDAEYECAHGRLPSDRTPPCGCWPGEPGYEARTMQIVHSPAAVAPLVAPGNHAPEPVDPELPPFVRHLVVELDAEIERLRAIREALTASVHPGP